MLTSCRKVFRTMRVENVEPLVSVVVPMYNCASYISDTVNSILDQDYYNLEILIVDDCSSDTSVDVANSFSDERVKCIRLDGNFGGPALPRNVGIKNSSGKYIFIFDSDDIMLPGKIRKTVGCLDSCSGAEMAFTNFSSIDESGVVISERFLDSYSNLYGVRSKWLDEGVRLINFGDSYSALLRGNFVGTSSVAIHRSVFDDVGIFDEGLKNADDVDMWLKIFRKHNVIYIDEILHRYRIRSNSISNEGFYRRSESIFRVFEKQFSYGMRDSDKLYLKRKVASRRLVLAAERLQCFDMGGVRKNSLLSFGSSPSFLAVKYFLLSLLPVIAIKTAKKIRKNG